MAFGIKESKTKKNNRFTQEGVSEINLKNTTPAIDDTRQLFDVSSLDIPKSDCEGGFNEEIESENTHLPPFPSFLSQKNNGVFKTSQNIHRETFTPIEEQDVMVSQSPSPSELDLNKSDFASGIRQVADEFTLPPLPEEELQDVPVITDNSPIVPEKTEQDIDEFALPPLPEEELQDVPKSEDIIEKAEKNEHRTDISVNKIPPSDFSNYSIQANKSKQQNQTMELQLKKSNPRNLSNIPGDSVSVNQSNPKVISSTASSGSISQTNDHSNQDIIKDPTSNHLTPKTDYTSPTFLRDLFSNGNVCITAPGGSFPIKDDMRLLLALFSNGRFFVSEMYKFDGKVLSFEYLAKKRHLQIGKPEYVPKLILSSIYEYAQQNPRAIEIERNSEEKQAQARMQRDFITIVSRAAALRVSDIHIVVAEHTTVMFRVNGLMQTEMEYNKDWGEGFVRAAFASSDISDSNYAQNEYQSAQKLGRTPLRGSNGKLVLPHSILGIRLQFNPIAFGTRYVVMRLLYSEESTEASGALEALGFTERETNFFYQLRGMPTGITIISGPTGSGKSTTLQRNMIAMLQERNYEINLITVEDPPEYPIPGARQMPVTNASVEEAKEREFTKALSAALRSDPDSLMIGEIRTLSAADLAFRGALSGHNVWTTLHANSAPAILMRLKDLGVEDFKLRDPEIVKGLLAQRLFRKLCPYCRVAAIDQLNNPSVQRLREAFGDIGLETSYLRGNGCKYCDFRGVKGRLAVAEIILPDSTFLDLMSKGDVKKALNYWINDLNGIPLREVALQHMFRGVIDIAEVERWTGFLNQVVIG